MVLVVPSQANLLSNQSVASSMYTHTRVSAYCSGKYCGLMCHPYNVYRKGKILVSSFVGMRRGEERKAASHWPEENAWVKRVEKL